MTNTCPCCGQLSDSAPPFFVDEDNSAVLVDGKTISMSPNQIKLLSIMAKKHPHPAKKSGIIVSMYGDRADGGPLHAESIIGICIHKIREKLKGTPLRIENVWSVGYKFVYENGGKDV
jgi:DNA-binding response OmpR family regulator